MTRTKTVLSTVALAVGLAMAGPSAQAEQIIFDFSGTVTSGTGGSSIIGQAVAGRIVVETNGLAHNSLTGSRGTSVTYSDTIANPELIVSELVVGGIAYDAGLYPGDQGLVSAFDATGVPPCASCSNPDYVAVQDRSTEYEVGSPPGQYFSRMLTLSWSSTAPDFVDLSNGFEPLDLVSMLTTLLPSGSYREDTLNCADLRCTGVASTQTNFRVDSITVHTPSVP